MVAEKRAVRLSHTTSRTATPTGPPVAGTIMVRAVRLEMSMSKGAGTPSMASASRSSLSTSFTSIIWAARSITIRSNMLAGCQFTP